MKIIKLKENQSSKLLLFFSGWATDENMFGHWESTEYDVILFYDYRKVIILENELLSKYSEIHVVAWSMGVWASEIALQNIIGRISTFTAINGSPFPADDEFGIPKKIFDGTGNLLTERTLQKFYFRICGSKVNFSKFQEHPPQRGVDELKEELRYIRNELSANKLENIKWDSAILGTKDAIFPLINLERYWKGKAEIKVNENPHFPFGNIETWEEIVNFAQN